MNQSEYQPQQRAALVAWWLAYGEELRTRDVARLTGLSMRGARDLLYCLAGVLPLYQDKHRVWQICTGEMSSGVTSARACGMMSA